MPELSEQEQVALYGAAEQKMGTSALALRDMALLAYEHRRNSEAQRVLSFVWGRNARLMARAVVRWPEWFMASNGHDPIATEPDELLALFQIAALPVEPAKQLKADWRRYSWRAWQVRDKVDEWRAAQRNPRRLQTRLRHARITEAKSVTDSPNGPHTHTLTLTWQGDPRPARGWMNRSVLVRMEQEPA